MDSEELLTQLADIHLPDPVSFWPPAPGWWLLAVLFLLALAFGIRQWLAVQHRQRLKHAALGELDLAREQLLASEDPGASSSQLRYVNAVNTVLRRVALQQQQYSDSADSAVGLSGDDWIAYLRRRGDASLLDDELSKLLSAGRFQKDCEVNPEKLEAMAQRWISSLYLRGESAASDQGSQAQEARA